MFDIGGVELLVIGAAALIIVGPKDLPRMVRSVGQWVGRAKGLARDFRLGLEDAARQADLDEVRKAADVAGDLNREMRRTVDFDDDFDAARRPPRPTPVSDPTRSSTAQRPADEPTRRAPAPSRAPEDATRRPEDATRRAEPLARADAHSRADGAVRATAEADDPLLSRFERGVRGGRDGDGVGGG